MNTKENTVTEGTIDLQARINAFHIHRERLATTLEEDLSLKLLVTVPHEQVRDFMLDCPRVQAVLSRVSFRVKKSRNMWFVCFETINTRSNVINLF